MFNDHNDDKDKHGLNKTALYVFLGLNALAAVFFIGSRVPIASIDVSLPSAIRSKLPASAPKSGVFASRASLGVRDLLKLAFPDASDAELDRMNASIADRRRWEECLQAKAAQVCVEEFRQSGAYDGMLALLDRNASPAPNAGRAAADSTDMIKRDDLGPTPPPLEPAAPVASRQGSQGGQAAVAANSSSRGFDRGSKGVDDSSKEWSPKVRALVGAANTACAGGNTKSAGCQAALSRCRSDSDCFSKFFRGRAAGAGSSVGARTTYASTPNGTSGDASATTPILSASKVHTAESSGGGSSGSSSSSGADKAPPPDSTTSSGSSGGSSGGTAKAPAAPAAPAPPAKSPKSGTGGGGGGGGGGGCFVAGTLVTMADGTKKAIEAVSIGDSVLSFDERTGRMTPGRVVHTFVHPHHRRFVTLGAGRIVTTPEHRFYIRGGWVAAGDMRSGDALTTVTMASRDTGAVVASNGDATVYNFEVEDTHTYVVDGVIVHNLKQEETRFEGDTRPQY